MRSAIIGAFHANNQTLRQEFVLASSRLTHRSWQSDVAAMAVAECVALTFRNHEPQRDDVIAMLRRLSGETEWQAILARLETSLKAQASVCEFAIGMGLGNGVTGYALHVVSVAVYAWLRHPGDFRTALISALECGGDTDTVGAILGALLGASIGKI